MNRYLRILLLITSVILMIWFGYAREWKLLVVRDGAPTFVNRYPKAPTGDYGMQLKGIFSFNPSPKLQSSIFFGLIFSFLGTSIVALLSESKKLTMMTAGLYFFLLLSCFILLQLSTLGVPYKLSVGLSHYLEDIVLSPFPVMLLVVLLKLNGSIKKFSKS